MMSSRDFDHSARVSPPTISFLLRVLLFLAAILLRGAMLQAQEVKAPVVLKHSDSVRAVAFSPDGKLIAAAYGDSTILLWDVFKHDIKSKLVGHTAAVECVRFSPDGKRVYSGSRDDSIRAWDSTTGKEVFALKKHGGIGVFDISPNGKKLAAAGWNNKISVWDTTSQQQLNVLEAPNSHVRGIGFRNGGRELVTVGDDEQALLWDLQSNKVTLTGKGFAYPRSYTQSPNAMVVYWGTTSGHVNTWDVRKETKVNQVEGHDSDVLALAFRPDGKMFASGGRDESLVLWDAVNHRIIKRLGKQPGEVNALAFSPDGAILAAGCSDGSIVLRNAADPEILMKKGFTDPKDRFRIMITDGWTVAKADEHSSAVLMYQVDNTGFRENLNVRVNDIPARNTLEEKAAEKEFASPDFPAKLLESLGRQLDELTAGKPQETKIDGVFAWHIAYTFKQEEMRVLQQQWLVMKNRKFYVLTWSASKQDPHRQQVQEMVESFRFQPGSQAK